MDTRWRTIVELGRIGPLALPEQVAREATAAAPAELFDDVVASRVYTAALTRLSAAQAAPELVGRLRALEEAETVRREAALPTTIAVLRRVTELGGHIIKGLALGRHYDGHAAEVATRHVGDIDAHVAELGQARELVDWLRGQGWVWDTGEFPWVKWTATGVPYGQLTLVTPDNTDPVTRVDLHIGPFSVGHAGLLPLVGWTPAEVLGEHVVVPDTESTIALIAAHAVNDLILSVKDVNDLYLVLASAEHVDWASTEELCGGVAALPALHDLLAAVRDVYGPGSAPEAPRTGALATTKPSPEKRAATVAEHAVSIELARGRSADDAEAVGRDAQRYFSADLAPRNADHALALERSAMTPRHCWRLLPEEVWDALEAAPASAAEPVVVADGLVLHRGGGAQALVMGGDVFVPTVWGDVAPASVGLARALATR